MYIHVPWIKHNFGYIRPTLPFPHISPSIASRILFLLINFCKFVTSACYQHTINILSAWKRINIHILFYSILFYSILFKLFSASHWIGHSPDWRLYSGSKRQICLNLQKKKTTSLRTPLSIIVPISTKARKSIKNKTFWSRIQISTQNCNFMHQRCTI
jgi:hypothetical protein